MQATFFITAEDAHKFAEGELVQMVKPDGPLPRVKIKASVGDVTFHKGGMVKKAGW
jgi:hypothetical protein